MSKVREIGITAETSIKVLVIRFEADWEFDCPVVVLDPVLRFHEDGCSCEHAIEDLLIDACVNGKLKDQENTRSWSIPYLRRRARAYLSGKRFPHKFAEAKEESAEFQLDKYGQLAVKE